MPLLGRSAFGTSGGGRLIDSGLTGRRRGGLMNQPIPAAHSEETENVGYRIRQPPVGPCADDVPRFSGRDGSRIRLYRSVDTGTAARGTGEAASGSGDSMLVLPGFAHACRPPIWRTRRQGGPSRKLA